MESPRQEELNQVQLQLDRISREVGKASIQLPPGWVEGMPIGDRPKLDEYYFTAKIWQYLTDVIVMVQENADDFSFTYEELLDDLLRIKVRDVPFGHELTRLVDAFSNMIMRHSSAPGSGVYGWQGQARETLATAQGLVTLIRSAELAADIRQTAGEVATSSLAEAHRVRAREEKRTADVLRVLAVTAVLAGFAVAAALAIKEREFSWTTQIAKAAVGVPLLLLGLYFVGESLRHRAAANYARDWQVTLESLRPFVADLDPDDRRSVMIKVADALFREPHTERLAPGEQQQTLLAQIAEIVRAARNGNET